MTNRTLTDGTVQVRVRFTEVDARGDISGGLLIGFKSQNQRYMMIQLGAYGRAYSMAEFVPSFGWKALELSGDVRELEPNRDYEMHILQTGQVVQLSVNGVRVLEKTLMEPLAGTQVGLFGWGRAPIDFCELAVRSSPPEAFVAMEFQEPFETLYREVIHPCLNELNVNVLKGDEIAGPGIIVDDIRRQIAEARIVIAEITAPNQNVFYELGYAHALNKPTILLARRGKELPFNVRSYRVIFYDDSIGGKPALERSLKSHIEAILHDS